jgi:Protein of unknown function (DUF1761)
MPEIQPNLVAIAIAVVANFFLGFIWYTPLFGKRWARELGLPEGYEAKGGDLAKGLICNAIGCFLIAFVLSSNIAAWTPSTWGSSLQGLSPIVQSINAAVFTWLGFMVPILLNGVAWEKRSWTLFAINGGYYLLSLFVAALIITHMR